jgi:hypothetical protein
MENLIKGIMTDKGIAKYDLNTLGGNLTIPACPIFPIWLCDSSTNEYTSPIGQYQSTCSLTSDDFLKNYWDCYLQDYDDGYVVTKKILGRDQSNTYDIYEYTFTPKKYSRTVMLSGGMHPPELPAEFGLAYFMKYVMERPSADFRWLRNNVRFKIIPLIQPWGFNQSILSYENSSGVNLNKNWDVDHVWTPTHSFGGLGTNGASPYSESETKVLVSWINENAYKADLWIDCHTDSSGKGDGGNLHYVVGCSNSSIYAKVRATQSRITQAYAAAGFFEEGTAKTGNSLNYASAESYSAKHLYAEKYCGIPGLMIEQYTGNPLWGGNPTINNSEADINNYVTMIRAYVLSMLERDEILLSNKDFFWYLYHWFIENHYSSINSNIEQQEIFHNVTYNANGHGQTPEPLINVSALPSNLPVLVDEADRYRFEGWYIDEGMTIQASPNEFLISDVTLYAKWVDEEGPIAWGLGGINTGSGAIMENPARGNTDYIRVRANHTIEVTNMSEYTIVDIAVYKEDLSYISLTNKYTLSKSNDTWIIDLTNFATNYPKGKYIRFSVKRNDGANISVSEFNDVTITST